jgi:hypothetical protein
MLKKDFKPFTIGFAEMNDYTTRLNDGQLDAEND